MARCERRIFHHPIERFRFGSWVQYRLAIRVLTESLAKDLLYA